jgi:NAD(P)-dependent dehydrogenase (short-subunit alcohol dehydrogenase family)
MSVNLLGTRRLIDAAVPTLLANGGYGRIVAVASSAGQLGLRHLAAYSAAKHAVVGLIRGVAMDLAETNVTANAVSPGSTRTAMLDASAVLYGLPSAESFGEQQPMGRLLEPSEQAAMIAWQSFISSLSRRKFSQSSSQRNASSFLRSAIFCATWDIVSTVSLFNGNTPFGRAQWSFR